MQFRIDRNLSPYAHYTIPVSLLKHEGLIFMQILVAGGISVPIPTKGLMCCLAARTPENLLKGSVVQDAPTLVDF